MNDNIDIMQIMKLRIITLYSRMCNQYMPWRVGTKSLYVFQKPKKHNHSIKLIEPGGKEVNLFQLNNRQKIWSKSNQRLDLIGKQDKFANIRKSDFPES